MPESAHYKSNLQNQHWANCYCEKYRTSIGQLIARCWPVLKRNHASSDPLMARCRPELAQYRHARISPLQIQFAKPALVKLLETYRTSIGPLMARSRPVLNHNHASSDPLTARCRPEMAQDRHARIGPLQIQFVKPALDQ